MKNKFKYIFGVLSLLMMVICLSSCYKKYADAPYPSQTIYMPAAVNGIYNINSVAVPGQTYRYTVDLTNSKLNIPLGAYLSGLYASGNVNINIVTRTDTVNSLISSGVLANTVLLPATNYSVPTSVMIPDQSVLGQFNLSVNLSFLLANPTQSYAIAVGISSSQVPSTTKNVTVVAINPAFLIPTANFSYVLDGTVAKQYDFTSSSTNTVSYSWNFGDGSAAVTTASPTHVYTSGTYTVTLTSTGAAGTINPSVKTATIVVP